MGQNGAVLAFLLVVLVAPASQPETPPTLHGRLRRLVAEANQGRERPSTSSLTALLDTLARGPFRDHLAGGFLRSAIESPPRAPHPHYEKRLCDNALLIRAYAKVFARTENLLYRDVTRETATWAIRELREPEGAFLASVRAPAEGTSSRYYLWTREEVSAALGQDRGVQFLATYGIEPPGLLTLTGSPFAGLGPSREVLQVRRGRRVRPGVDDRVVAGWNGLMIGALATSGSLLKRGADLEAGRRAADAVVRRLGPAKALKHEASGAGTPAGLQDHAFLAEGLLDLYEATGEARWQNEAVGLTEAAVTRLWAVGSGGFYEDEAAASGAPRLKTARDSDLPSANAVMASVFGRLATLTGQERYRRLAVKTVEAFKDELRRDPDATQALAAAAALLSAAASPSPPAETHPEGPGASSGTR